MVSDDRPEPLEPPLGPGEPRSFGNGRYVVRRRLGAGNFATVYLAFDERLDVPVAVKLLSDRWSWEPEVRGRFVQEARLLRSLNDSRVVQIRDIAETDDGRPYLVMDLAAGGTLEQRLVELAQRGTRPTVAQLRQVTAALADALGFLHERRIAHRDIKPSNLLITTSTGTAAPDDGSLLRRGERLMLGDLGLAKDLAFDSGVTVGVGTAGYMAPEQSLAGAKIDTRTDIFAASALLAQIASGEPPDPTRRCSNGAVESGRPMPPTIPTALATALSRGLDTDPDKRPQTIEDWHRDVDAALVTLSDVELAPPAPGGGSRRFAIIGAVAVLGLGVAGTALVLSGGDESTDSPTTVDHSIVADSTTAAPTSAATTVDPAALSVELIGPTEITRGVEAVWTVTSANAVSGVWSVTGPVQPSEEGAQWAPGNWFQGSWNVQGTFELTLTVLDAAGASASDSITFTVT